MYKLHISFSPFLFCFSSEVELATEYISDKHWANVEVVYHNKKKFECRENDAD